MGLIKPIQLTITASIGLTSLHFNSFQYWALQVHFHIWNACVTDCVHHLYTMHIKTKEWSFNFFLNYFHEMSTCRRCHWSAQKKWNENDNIFERTQNFTVSVQFIFPHTDESDFNLFKVTPALVAIFLSFWLWLRPCCLCAVQLFSGERAASTTKGTTAKDEAYTELVGGVSMEWVGFWCKEMWVCVGV